MIVKDDKGNELLELIDVDENQAEKLYHPVNHALVVVRVGKEYLMGWNHWRLAVIENYRTDKEEVEKLAFYSAIGRRKK